MAYIGLCHITLEGTKVFSLFLCIQSLVGFIESLDHEARLYY
jgi:hypothetical protein